MQRRARDVGRNVDCQVHVSPDADRHARVAAAGAHFRPEWRLEAEEEEERGAGHEEEGEGVAATDPQLLHLEDLFDSTHTHTRRRTRTAHSCQSISAPKLDFHF